MPERMPNTPSSDRTPHSFTDRHFSGRHWWIWLLVIVLFGAGGFSLFQHQAAGRSTKAKSTLSPGAVPVVTAIASKGDIGVYVNALGSVTPVYTVTVKSRVDGQLMSVNYSEGQMAHKDDPLVEIDPRPFQAQLTQAEGRYARDKALLENAYIDLNRYKLAYSKNAISKQALDTQAATIRQYVEFCNRAD